VKKRPADRSAGRSVNQLGSAYQYNFSPSWISRGARTAMIWPKRSLATVQLDTFAVHVLSSPLATESRSHCVWRK
jgi:hypothetical protein